MQPRFEFSVRNFIIVVFCLFFMLLTVADNLTGSAIRTSLQPLTDRVLMPLGMWQRWDMFSGGESDLNARVKRVFSDGTVRYEYSVLGNQHAPWFPNVHTNFDYSIITQSDPQYATAVLNYLCKQKYEGKTPIVMDYETAWLTVPTLDQAEAQKNPSDMVPTFTTVKSVQCPQ